MARDPFKVRSQIVDRALVPRTIARESIHFVTAISEYLLYGIEATGPPPAPPIESDSACREIDPQKPHPALRLARIFRRHSDLLDHLRPSWIRGTFCARRSGIASYVGIQNTPGLDFLRLPTV